MRDAFEWLAIPFYLLIDLFSRNSALMYFILIDSYRKIKINVSFTTLVFMIKSDLRIILPIMITCYFHYTIVLILTPKKIPNQFSGNQCKTLKFNSDLY